MAKSGVTMAIPIINTDRPLPRKYKSYMEDNNSPLHAACYYGDYDSALMLLLANHEFETVNIWQETPLHQCSSQGHLDIMMLLLDGGANVNAIDKDNYTPLHHAIIHGNRDATELLLCYGATVFRKEGVDSDSRSPLELASHVHVCYEILQKAQGKVWSLQHICRISIRKYLGVSRRRRIKELPLPRHVISFLSSLPISCSEALHENWGRIRTIKSAAVKSKVVGHRPKVNREGGSILGASLQALRTGYS